MLPLPHLHSKYTLQASNYFCSPPHPQLGSPPPGLYITKWIQPKVGGGSPRGPPPPSRQRSPGGGGPFGQRRSGRKKLKKGKINFFACGACMLGVYIIGPYVMDVNHFLCIYGHFLLVSWVSGHFSGHFEPFRPTFEKKNKKFFGALRRVMAGFPIHLEKYKYV